VLNGTGMGMIKTPKGEIYKPWALALDKEVSHKVLAAPMAIGIAFHANILPAARNSRRVMAARRDETNVLKI